MTRSVIKDNAQYLQQLRDHQKQPLGPNTASSTTTVTQDVQMPEALQRFLLDLRLLRHVPLTYLVPDPSLLPPESIRFFFLDPTWIDRLVDGAFGAANIGSMDQGYSQGVLGHVRAFLDRKLEAMANLPTGSWNKITVTGLLLRSVVVRRWPGLTVRAFGAYPADPTQEGKKKQLATLRLEQVAPGIVLALFAGVPQAVEVCEPDEGTRFGIERSETNGVVRYTLQPRPDDDTQKPAKAVDAPLRDAELRVLNMSALRENIARGLGWNVTDPAQLAKLESSRLALSLQQAPFVQVFRGESVDDGAQVANLGIALVQKHAAELAALTKLGGL